MRVFKQVACAWALAAFGLAAAAQTWQMATPYPDSNFHTQNVKAFVADVAEATDGKLKINVHSAGSLIKHPEIKNAVRSRQVEIGEFFVSILSNENPIFALDSIPFVAASFDDARRLYEASGPVIAEVLGRQGIKVLYSVAWPPQGLYADRAIEDVKDMRGLKFRVYNSQLERFAELVGALPAQVEVPDLAQAFSTGRVNLMLTSTSTGVDTSAWDYLTHFYDVKAYLPRNIVVVNQRVFDALDADVQQAILDAAEKAAARGEQMAEEDHMAKRDVMEEHGIKISDGSEALNSEFHKLGEQMGQEWAKRAGDMGEQVLDAYHKAQ